MSTVLRVCVCGQLSPTPLCGECRRRSERERTRESFTARGYDAAWVKLSSRARKLQPFCELCSSPDNLSGDHTPQAWLKHEAGERLTLADIRVLCRRCNSAAGSSRPGSARATA
jgi:5-methylcytosine-specific restriction enzyme A